MLQRVCDYVELSGTRQLYLFLVQIQNSVCNICHQSTPGVAQNALGRETANCRRRGGAANSEFFPERSSSPKTA